MRSLVQLLLVALLALASAAAASGDPCLSTKYTTENYGECCSNGAYRKDGHKEICRDVGPRIKRKKEL